MNIKEFWEEKHRTDDKLSLSGHGGLTVLAGLFVKKELAGSRVLEIGVGLGYCTSALHLFRAKVYAVDISERALERVGAFVEESLLESNIDKLPSDFFDLAISYCVTQHMNNDGLKRQLKEVIRSLRIDGTFAMQYSFPLYGTRISEELEDMKNGAVNRPIEVMYKMVEVAGGYIIESHISGVYPQYGSGWAVIHIGRKI